MDLIYGPVGQTLHPKHHSIFWSIFFFFCLRCAHYAAFTKAYWSILAQSTWVYKQSMTQTLCCCRLRKEKKTSKKLRRNFIGRLHNRKLRFVCVNMPSWWSHWIQQSSRQIDWVWEVEITRRILTDRRVWSNQLVWLQSNSFSQSSYNHVTYKLLEIFCGDTSTSAKPSNCLQHQEVPIQQSSHWVFSGQITCRCNKSF